MSADTEAITDAADRLFTAIEHADVSFLTGAFAPDVAVWRSGARHDDDKGRALQVLSWFIDRTSARRYEILDRQVFDTGVVQQHILHATRAGTDEPLALRVCIVIKFSADLLISRVDEYFDPAELAPLLT